MLPTALPNIILTNHIVQIIPATDPPTKNMAETDFKVGKILLFENSSTVHMHTVRSTLDVHSDFPSLIKSVCTHVGKILAPRPNKVRVQLSEKTLSDSAT